MARLMEYGINAAGIIEAPERESQSLEQSAEQWCVTVYNNDTNTYEEVMTVLMLATKCTTEEAYIEAWEIDHYGLCTVHRDSEETCKTIAHIVSTIGIRVEVEKG